MYFEKSPLLRAHETFLEMALSLGEDTMTELFGERKLSVTKRLYTPVKNDVDFRVVSSETIKKFHVCYVISPDLLAYTIK